MDFIVEDVVGTEAIVGLDFLTKYESSSHKTLYLAGVPETITWLA